MNKNNKILIILLSAVVLMFGFGFALVPLYRVFCQVTGVNGKLTARNIGKPSTHIDLSRSIIVIFDANRNEEMPWDFYPMTTQVTLHPGENIQILYYAKNPTNKTMTVQAIPSISPGDASKYIKKTECFCFTKQTFAAHQEMQMPVLFHIDTNLPKSVNTITLSYTLFDINSSQKPLERMGVVQ